MPGRNTNDLTIFQDAERGDPYARLGLAYMYHHGKNIDPDSDLAVKWYIKSSNSGCSRAKWELAKIFRDGTIAERDNEKFIKYLKAAAESGVPEAKVELGIAHLIGDHVEINEERAFQWINSAARQDNLMGQFILGYMYGNGIGVDRDLSKREEWYTKIGLRGNGELFYWIGRNFEYGLLNIKTDPYEAGRWYKMGADMGHEKCILCWRAVLSALDGGARDSLEEREARIMNTGVEKEKLVREQALVTADRFFEEGDDEKAFSFYRMAADLGNPDALFTLAMLYHTGIHVKRNDNTAIALLTKASLVDSEDAQFMLGMLYEEGRGVKKDKEEAIKYYTKAAANGYLAAYYRLSLYMDNPEIHVRNSVAVMR
ncbi:Sel1 repeat protein [Candidatus Methanoplasma termitum]|uniref:Sel1 repeat protein n=1 Tax=Candidatus Methanoplasma termitum TaxID=1577791 RepID=A0A0A7LGB5_9ARCH|nr:SEL1-like repeat protein [Candidatus Methanoplasma termitum]AIZ56536.1 Sel1 repeat protein [Candidatus Methanoplasma termitum]